MDWTVDYGQGPTACQIPHSWNQDVDVRWEGPAMYSTSISVDGPNKWLVFHGVSYHAKVFLDDDLACVHNGIWDAFAVPLPLTERGSVTVRVEVVKNGGTSFPVRDVLSGFLPYVFHTFGGIFRDVEIVESLTDPTAVNPEPPPSRIKVAETKLSIDGQPWYMRGVLSWGWYPVLGRPDPTLDTIRNEVRRIKELGFNLIKFCLWLPPHSYFQVLEEEGIWAWVELPLWMPGLAMDMGSALEEVKKIVLQYRKHDRIICWTCGCELTTGTPQEFRQKLVQMVSELTGCPLVKDNSGGAEMYGGDPREYGTFYDYHPYCEPLFYPLVLDSLLNGPRTTMPILLGEYNDYDLYRPMESLRADNPYWASSDSALNDVGVRWQHDVPGAMGDPARSLPSDIERHLEELSQSKSGWIREFVTREVCARSDIAGYVVTGLANTPISTSGVLQNRALDGIFGDDTFFVIPSRKPPWVTGGNRPGWKDSYNFFPGVNTVKLGARFTEGFQGDLHLTWTDGDDQFNEKIAIDLSPNEPMQIAELCREFVARQHQTLAIGHGDGTYFEFACYDRFDWKDDPEWSCQDRPDLLPLAEGTGKYSVTFDKPDALQDGILFLEHQAVLPMSFWRECITWNVSELVELDSWDFLFSVSCDRAIDPAWLENQTAAVEWLLTRVDTRTYARHPYIVRIGGTLVTTLRPWGGLGAQPPDFASNPAGHELMRLLIGLLMQE